MSNENETFLAELLHKRLMFVEATRANDFSEGIAFCKNWQSLLGIGMMC